LALAGQLRDAVATHVAGSPWVLARRSGWKQPAPGTSYAATRGELYAVDPIAKRFVRVTHTDHSVAAYLRAPSGEVLLAGFTQAEVPDPGQGRQDRGADPDPGLAAHLEPRRPGGPPGSRPLSARPATPGSATAKASSSWS
jgi:hypothetical protein